MHFKLLYTKVFNFNTTKVGGATEQPYWNCIRRDLSPCTRRTTAQLICTEDGIAINDDEESAPFLSRLPAAESSALSTSHRHAACGDAGWIWQQEPAPPAIPSPGAEPRSWHRTRCRSVPVATAGRAGGIKRNTSVSQKTPRFTIRFHLKLV